MVGCALATLLHAKAPRKASFLPTLFSIQLWRGGLKKDTLKQVSRTGLCLGYKGTVNAIDRIRKSFDEVARATKEELHVQLSSGVIEHPTADEDELELSTALPHTIVDEDLQDDEEYDWEDLEEEPTEQEDENDEEGEEEAEPDEDDLELEDYYEESFADRELAEMQLNISGIAPVYDDSITIGVDKELHPGFTTCWDNVGKKVVTRNPSVDKNNTYINMALGYMAINRVPVTHLQAFDGNMPAVELPLDTFNPNEDDFSERDFRMSTIIGRILTRHLSWFQDNFRDYTIPHIMHMHSNEMRKKSVLVNLGVFDENPSSTNGAIGIYRKIQEYVPSVDDKPYPTIIYGDGLSCERGNGAHNTCSGELNAWQRLEGLQPSPQEFHKEMLLLQDHFKEFGKESAAEFGTLFFLKNTFNFRNVSMKDIDNCFADAWELMCLVTEGYVCLASIEKLGMDSVDGKPRGAPDGIEDGDDEAKQKYMRNIQNELLAYFRGDYESHESSYSYCNCGTDLGDNEPMVGCAAKSQCKGREWYHLRCLGLQLEELPKGSWYCSDACAKRKRGKRQKSNQDPVNIFKKDHKEEYCKAMVWRGLNLLCRRDAVREGDGEAMIRYWRFDLQYFLQKKHPKYVILAHRLLCATHGWLPEKLKEELIWNRTVNYSGGVGRNHLMDLMNELLNSLFKDQLDNAKGRYTEETIQRCSQIIGPLGECLDNIFDEKVIENELYRHRRRARNRDSNVQKLINYLLDENLFKTVSGRQFKAFPAFEYKEDLDMTKKYKHKMVKLASVLDQRTDIVLNH